MKSLLLSVALVLAWTGTAFAVDVPTLYTAAVPFDDRADTAREDAYRAALVDVLERVSGPELARNPNAVDQLFPVPAHYVTQYRPGENKRLWVSFDGDAIERILRNSGYTVWGGDRPLTLVWLAVDWGGGAREIVAADDAEDSVDRSRTIDRNRLLRERMLEVAERRGLPIAFPLLDSTDMQGVSFSDIWGGFDERVIEASGRYDVNSVLIGRVRATSSQDNRWSYHFGREQRDWGGPAESVMAQIADLMAAEFAVGGNAPAQRLVLNVAGIETVDAYGSVQSLLSEVPMIERIHVTEVAGDTVSYEVEVRGGSERLKRALAFAGLIEQEASFGSLDYFYSP